MNISGNNVQSALAKAGRTIKTSSLLTGGMWWLVVCLSTWLALFLLDNFFRLPPALRLPFSVAAGALTAITFVRNFFRPAIERQRIEQTAITLEKRFDVSDNLLINACQMESQNLSEAEKVFARHTIEYSQRRLGKIPPSSLWRIRSLKKLGRLSLFVIVLWLAYCVFLPRQSANALLRYAMPLGDVPPAGSALLTVRPSSELTICENDDLEVTACVSGRDGGLPGGERAALIVWHEGASPVPESSISQDSAPMLAATNNPGSFNYTFRMVRRQFSFRVFAGDTYSRSIRVNVRPLPKIVASLFRVSPPAYTGMNAFEVPGPPSPLSCRPGSSIETELVMDQPVLSLAWNNGGDDSLFSMDNGKWIAGFRVDSAGRYDVKMTAAFLTNAVIAAEGAITLETDVAPEIEFLLDNRNLLLNPWEKFDLPVKASDDLGIERIDITWRSAEQDATESILRTWRYIGPPGHPGPARESHTLVADPRLFAPGITFLLQAVCSDFSPAGNRGKSRPLILRVKSWQDIAIPHDHPLAKAFMLLKQAVAAQKRSNDSTANLETHLQEAIEKKRLPDHQSAMSASQGAAKDCAGKALEAFAKDLPDDPAFTGMLDSLANREMPWVIDGIARLATAGIPALPESLNNIGERQEYILANLIALLGKVPDKAGNEQEKKKEISSLAAPPTATAGDAGKSLRDDLKEFSRTQERVIEKSKTLLDKGPEDLTAEEEKILGELARIEDEWARFFEEKLTDFSKLPLQDFADGSIAEEFNDVIQDMKLAADALYRKNIEIAVPLEQSGLEKAEELMHNLEKWIMDAPDKIKWSMEEPPMPQDLPLAELPAELEDIVGELIDSEEAMTDDVEDVTSSWMDSIDKGAGWGALDGPISSMSAKGVTGNMLPNQIEVGGRSGEGRTGRSHGQMVEATAEGKDGRKTPTRLTPSPFEPGSIEDSSTEDPGGATGGGKLSGYTGEGLRGPAAPPARVGDMKRLAEQQAIIRQGAETLALTLRKHHLPTGDLELSINTMKDFEDAASRGDGVEVRRSFSRILDALYEARTTFKTQAGLHRDTSKLPEWARGEIMSGLRDGTPRGYEDMIAEYFRALAEMGAAAENED